MDKRAIVENNVGDVLLDTIHQNTIAEIRVYSGSKIGIDKISSIGVDGKMVIWDLKVYCRILDFTRALIQHLLLQLINSSMAGLRIV